MIAYNIPSRVVVNVPPAARRAGARSTASSRVKQANNDELRPIEGLEMLAGNDDIFLRDAGIRRRRWDPRRLAPGRPADAGDVGRRAGRRHRPGARDRRRLRPLYEALGVTTNPIPLKAALAMTGPDPHGDPAASPGPADAEQRATVRAALESVGLPCR